MQASDTIQIPAALAGGYRMQGLFRFVLALMVLWSHSVLKFFPEFSGWFPALQLGNVAVSSFFVLSGYLMGEAIVMWYADRLPKFLINRYLRIGPPLFVAALVSITVHFTLMHAGVVHAGLEHIPENAISNDNAVLSLIAPLFPLNGRIAYFMGVSPEPYYEFVRYSWAIFTELIFYWILFFYAVSARHVGAWIAGAGFLLIAFSMFVAGTVSYNGYLLDTRWAEIVSRLPLVNHLQWAPHFLLGVMISRCERNRWRSPLLRLILCAAGVAAAVQLGLYARTAITGTLLILCLYGLTLSVGFSLILSSKQHYIVGPFLLGQKQDKGFGNLSYPVYINHYALALAILSLLYAADIDVRSFSEGVRVGAFILFNGVIIVCSSVLIRLTDSLTDQLRDRFRGASI